QHRLITANEQIICIHSTTHGKPGYGKTLRSTTDGEGSKGCTLSTPKEIPWLSTNLPTSLIAIWAHANPVLLTCWMRLAIRALMSVQPLRCQKTRPSKTPKLCTRPFLNPRHKHGCVNSQRKIRLRNR